MLPDGSRPWVLPAVGPDPPFRFPDVDKRTLANGVRLWTVEHRQASLITLVLVIPTGAGSDPPHQAGLAALTADLLDEGSRDRGGIELHKALARIGGYLNTEVTSDVTALSLTALARHTCDAVSLLIEIATQPRFDPSEFERVRELRVNRLTQIQQVPSTVADRVFLETLYGSHPYGHLAIGTELSLRALAVDDVATFHAKWYAPSRWTLIAVGDVGGSGLRQRAAALAGAIPDSSGLRPSADRLGLSDPPPPRERLVFVPRDGAVQSEIRLGHVGAARSTPDYHALLVLNMVLGGQFVSRLNLSLREDKGYTYGARTVFDCRLGRGPFSLQVSVETAATAAAIRVAVCEIADIREARPPTVAELAVARAALTRGFPRRCETAGQIARVAMQLALFDLPSDYFTEFVPRVAAVSADEVTRAASRHLHPDQLVAVVVGSRAEVHTSLSGLGFGDPVERRQCPISVH